MNSWKTDRPEHASYKRNVKISYTRHDYLASSAVINYRLTVLQGASKTSPLCLVIVIV